MAVDAMAVTHRKKVHALRLAEVWAQAVAVLVHFVRVPWLVSTRCGKRKFRDCIVFAWLCVSRGILLFYLASVALRRLLRVVSSAGCATEEVRLLSLGRNI